MQLKFGFDERMYYGREVDTGQVSTWLESHYGILEEFIDIHSEDIAKLIEEDVAEMITRTIEKGVTPTLTRISKHSMLIIKAMFDTFIRSREVEGLGIPGVPTERAKMGFKSATKRRKGRFSGTSRPSFLDTELYIKSFYARLEE
jgi:hypothetical protein